MKKYDLTVKSGRKGHVRKPKQTEEQYFEENLIKDKFSITESNCLWCSDITELNCLKSKLYVCEIIDVATRRLVGCKQQKSNTNNSAGSFKNVGRKKSKQTEKNDVYHSDRGCQYTAKKTKELIEKSGFRKSISRHGTPSDNQPIESFWKTFEGEMPDIRHLPFEEK